MLLRRLVLSSRARFSTLMPSRLVPSDWVDFSSKYYARARYTPPSAPAPDAVSHIPYYLPDGADVLPPGQRLRFSEGATGFLYAHTVPGHPAAGQVRLRCVPKGDPGAFANGHDLLLVTGLPWAVPFFALASAAVAPLRACLLEEAFVTPDDLEHWARGHAHERLAVVHAGGEPFFYNFTHPAPHLYVLHGRDVHPMRFQKHVYARPASFHGASANSPCILTPLTLCTRVRAPRARVRARRARFCASRTAHRQPHRAQSRHIRKSPRARYGPVEGALLFAPSGERRVLDSRLPTYHALRFLMPAEDRRAVEHEMGLETDGDVSPPAVWYQEPFLPSRVSRTIAGQALEALGAEPLLWDLAKLMDTRLWHDTVVHSTELHWLSSTREVMVTNHTMTLSSTPHAAETVNFGTRFLHYAKRVRRLCLYEVGNDVDGKHGDIDRYVVEPDVLALWAANPDVLPLLEELEIEKDYLARSPAREALLPAFIAHPGLRKLTLFFGHEDIIEPLERTQAALLDACARLHHITLAVSSANDAWDEDALRTRWADWVGSVARHAVNVQHLDINVPFNYTDLLALSTHPTLVLLSTLGVGNVPSASARLPSDAFPALRFLKLYDSEGHAILSRNLLSFGPSSALEQCTLNIGGDLSCEDLNALLTAVCQHKRMVEISIDACKVDGPPPTLGDTTALLRACRPSSIVQILHLVVYDCFPLHADHITHVLHMYPRLHTWRWHWDTDFWAAMSLEGFMAMLKDRPAIRMLPIRITSGDLPSVQAQAAFGTHSYGKKLTITESAFSSELCEVISQLFPNLRIGGGQIAHQLI